MFELVRDVFHTGDDTVIEVRLILPTQLGRYLPIFSYENKRVPVAETLDSVLNSRRGTMPRKPAIQCATQHPHNPLQSNCRYSCYPPTSFFGHTIERFAKGFLTKILYEFVVSPPQSLAQAYAISYTLHEQF
jgi:hypothetical protein